MGSWPRWARQRPDADRARCLAPNAGSGCGPYPTGAPCSTRARRTQALEARAAVVPDQVLRQQLAGVLEQPEHRRVAHGHLPLDPRRKRQREGADRPFELLRGIPQGAVGLRLVGWRGLRDGLKAQLLRHPSAEVHQGRLLVRLEQDSAAMAQPVGAGHGLAHRVLAHAALAQHWARHDRVRGAVLEHQDGE
eukprot:15008633-Alexandrium_andersonii.AAC.1